MVSTTLCHYITGRAQRTGRIRARGDESKNAAIYLCFSTHFFFSFTFSSLDCRGKREQNFPTASACMYLGFSSVYIRNVTGAVYSSNASHFPYIYIHCIYLISHFLIALDYFFFFIFSMAKSVCLMWKSYRYLDYI